MKKLNQFILLSIFLIASAKAQVFADAPVVLGELPQDTINESSGLAYDDESRLLFHINDSGDGPYVYTSQRDGSNVTRWTYDDEDPKDVEELAIGPCAPDEVKKCLYVADIGDNRRKRSHVRITLIELEEFLLAQKNGRHEVEPRKVYKLEYPDRAHDAESLIVTEDGKIFILTKEWNQSSKEAFPSKLFSFDPKSTPLREELQYVQSVDFSKIIPSVPWWGQVPTAMDYSSSRKEVSILTYSSIVIISWENLLKGGQAHQQHLHLIGPELPQQEAITYTPEGLIYSTEFVEEYGPANLYFWSYH